MIRMDGRPLELLRQQNGMLSRYWYKTDRQGSVVALTDINGTVVNRYNYDVWGALTSSSESVPQRLRYADYWWDSELDWYWVSVRSYDPGLKRWLQPDPSQQDGVRTYVYGGNAPVDATDPTGLSADITASSIADGVISFFVVAASAVVAVAASPEILATAAVGAGSVLVIGGVSYVVTHIAADSSGLPPCYSGPPPPYNPGTIDGGTVPDQGTVILATCVPVTVIVLHASTASADAAALGYKKRIADPPFKPHGKPVYTDARNYITPDRDGHNGGVWKKYDWKGRRLGTYDGKLNRIRD